MSIPLKERYFEDYQPGEVHEFGSYTVTADEIVEFAKRYDPQPFHTDPAAAAKSIYGGLIASGWMTGALMMRILVDNFISQASSMGSPGMDELRWLKPVRPGDTLRVRVAVIEARRSQSQPVRGILLAQQVWLNQNNVVVMSAESRA
ncbi:MAG: MaoC family dehydratase, partial [Betaproteobacteria bacterium]